MNIGKRIKKLRINSGLTQKDVALKLNISEQAISKWEGERSNPDVSMLEPLADLFDVSIDFLITGKERIIIEPSDPCIEYFKKAISPFSAQEPYISQIKQFEQKYKTEEIIQCLDIVIKKYGYIDGELIPDSIDYAMSKLGGTLYNVSVGPIIIKIDSFCKQINKPYSDDFKNIIARTKGLLLRYKNTNYFKKNNEAQQIILLDEMLGKIPSYISKSSLYYYNETIENIIIDIENKDKMEQKIEKGYCSSALFFGFDDIKDRIEEINNMLKAENGIEALKMASACHEMAVYQFLDFFPELKKLKNDNHYPKIEVMIPDLLSFFKGKINKETILAFKHYSFYLNPDIINWVQEDYERIFTVMDRFNEDMKILHNLLDRYKK